MTQTTFDTLEYFEKLKSAGVSENQAKVQVEAMQGIINSYDMATRKEQATKGDIQDLRNEIQNEIQNVRNEIQNEIQNLRNEIAAVRNEIAETKHEILKWIVTAMLAQTALLVGIIAFLR